MVFKKLDEDNKSFLRTDSFFFVRVNVSPNIQDTGFPPLSFFFGIYIRPLPLRRCLSSFPNCASGYCIGQVHGLQWRTEPVEISSSVIVNKALEFWRRLNSRGEFKGGNAMIGKHFYLIRFHHFCHAHLVWFARESFFSHTLHAGQLYDEWDINVDLSLRKHIKLLLRINKIYFFTCGLMSLQRHSCCKSRVQYWMDQRCGIEHDPNNDHSWLKKTTVYNRFSHEKRAYDSSPLVHFQFHLVVVFFGFQ